MRSIALLCLFAAAMPAAAQPPAVVAEPAATPPKPKLICHYEAVTGSLAARVKRCMTAKQWNDMAANARSTGEALQGNGFSCGSGVRPCR